MNRDAQIKAEIDWLDREMDKVRERMKRKPSKLRHFMDLHRQKKEKAEKLKYSAIHNNAITGGASRTAHGAVADQTDGHGE